ncbi:TPA: hypothetical protein U1X08_001963, partial [Streptococcus suis]|nr:hypothetical protein [Streptococcus suis]
MTSSNATPSAFGWVFQANLGLYLIMDEDLKQIKKFKIEGETEDIEIYYRDTTERKPKFIQAKSQEDPISDGTTSKHLSNALSSLLQVVTKVSGEYSELIYGTNIEIPIRARVKQKLFEGNRIKLYYKELPEQFQTKIDGIVDVSEITSEELMSFKERFSILKISFYGQDNETRYKVVQEKVTSKLRSLGIEQYKCNRIFYYFQKEFIQNASKRVEYSIEDLGLTIILFSFEDEENWSFNNLDIPEELISRIKAEFSNYILEKQLDFQFISQLVGDYKKYSMTTPYIPSSQKIQHFVNDTFSNYSDYFLQKTTNVNQELIDCIIKVTVYRIL